MTATHLLDRRIPVEACWASCWITRRAYWLMVPPPMYPRSDNITKPQLDARPYSPRSPGTCESQNRHIDLTHHHGKAPAWRSRGPRRDFAAPAGEVNDTVRLTNSKRTG